MKKYKKYFFVFLGGKYYGVTQAVTEGRAKGNVGSRRFAGVELATFIENSEAFSENDPIPADIFSQIPKGDFPRQNQIPKSDGRFIKFLEGQP